MLALNPSPIPRPRWAFIMAGQSNMVGHGALSQVPAYPLGNRCHIYGYNEAWRAGAEPMSDHAGIVHSVFLDDENLASCGMAFADSLSRFRPGIEIGLIPCAKGGSGMASWARNLSTGSLYGATLARAQAAILRPNTALKGVIWYQGEEDTKNSANAAAWAARFQQFVSDMRADLGISDLPVIWTKLGPNPSVPERPYWTTVQAQQAAASITDGAMIDASDLTTISDNVHLNTPSLVTIGARAAVAMDGLL